MTPFGSYARYYDLLYRTKDYGAEAGYVLQLIRRYAPDCRSLLDLGCGTGIHACVFSHAGYEVVGIDRSEEMLAQARDKQKHLDPKEPGSVQFAQGDIRNFRLGCKFDAVVALFHVISYLPTDDELEAAFACVREHLNPRGVFVFDFWYGPGVLTERPQRRVKVLEDDDVKIIRIATPTMHCSDNLVDVNYKLQVIEKASDRCERLIENHRMRFFFQPELETLLSKNRLKPVGFTEWLSDRALSETSWSAVVTAIAGP